MFARRSVRAASALSGTSWTCPACCIRATRPVRAARLSSQQRRDKHIVPALTFDKTFRTQGVPGLFSAEQYNIAWLQYEGMILKRLNELVAGEPHEHTDMKSLILRFARDPMAAAVFNHASMAHNNHFFFRMFSTHPKKLSNYIELQRSLEQSFGSVDALRTTMLDTAASMFGPGFVWLVYVRNESNSGRRGGHKILTTYLAGTPYPEAGYRQQGVDTNTERSLASFGPYSKFGQEQARYPPGAAMVMPLLCVNTWEHVYIRDFGVQGKQKYLADWWDAVDWDAVCNNAPNEAKQDPTTRFSP